jgi:hypothetical protein
MTGPLYGVLTEAPSAEGLRTRGPIVGRVTEDADLAHAQARHLADTVPDGGKVIPVTVVPGIIPARQPGQVRLYVAGPMTGHEEWNFPAFREATARLRHAGFDVVSPHELDEVTGFDSTAPVAEFTPEHHRAALRRDVLAVLDVDGIAVLDGWEVSSGARAEVALGNAVHIPYRSPAEWIHLYPTGSRP